MKRLIDIVGALLVLLLLSPVIIMVAIGIGRTIGRPIFFRQERPGLQGEPFEMIKFRTMTDDRDASGELRPDAERLNAVGRFLRATSLDELPELWNVLRGDMSLVGPRPLLMQYLNRYTPEQARRHEVRPGITGYAQVNGRNALDWPERLALDIWYVDHRSVWLDLNILWATMSKVVRRDGISAPGEATMTEFLGNEVEPRVSTRLAGAGCEPHSSGIRSDQSG